MSVVCHDTWGSLAEKAIDCGPDAVIDIIFARVTLLIGQCNNNLKATANYIISDVQPHDCSVDLPLLV